MVAVLGFLLHQEEDPFDVFPLCSGWSVEFWKAPPANSIGRVMPGYCWVEWDSVRRNHVVVSDRLVSGESGAKHCYMLPSWDMFRSMVNSETENVMKAES
jgi:hypothetical protein